MPIPTAPALSPAVAQFAATPRKMLIGGEWVEAASGKTFATLNPATEETITQVAEGGAEDINRAVAAARRAFEEPGWARMRPNVRERLLHRIADLIEAHADELAELEALDNGKSVTIARVIDVVAAIECFRYMAGWPTKLEGATIPLSVPFVPDQEFFAYTQREAVGVVGQIIPWNFPLLMAAWKLAPALAAGCTIVLKPAEETPLTALRLGELMIEAGVPDGVVNIVTGYGETAGAALAAHPDVDKIAFTGSTEVGKLIVQAATGNLKKGSLELGGKSPAIIMADADMSLAIEGAANAIFFNSGQVCTAGSRLFIEKPVYDQVIEGVANIAANLPVGPGLAPETLIGPLVSRTQFERVTGYIDTGRKEGAEVAAGGERVGNKGYFVAPTLLAGTNRDMTVVREEIFGPVVCAQSFEDLDEVAAAANDTPYGLAAGVWGQDIARIHRLVPAIKAGTVWVNCYNALDSALPFGGYKQSGWGRELGRQVLDLYTESKSVCIMT